VEVLAGSKLVDWFSILEDVRPPIVPLPDAGNCDCGAPMETRVNRAGQYLLVCSRYPDCREMRKPAAAVAGSKPEAEGRKPETGGRKPETGGRKPEAGGSKQPSIHKR
jgi:ssDNA-binding Zn-finger/Zn-ribbon topoisomerase 1